MRLPALLFSLALMGGCSCDRRPDAETRVEAVTVDDQPAPAPDSAEATGLVGAAVSPTRADAIQAASTLHAYLNAISAKDWEKANTFWTGGKPSARPGDTAVRAIADLRNLRIKNDTPTPLDDQVPPRTLEIPVVLRVQDATGTHQLKGWYRMRLKVAGDGWEITSASVQPTLD